MKQVQPKEAEPIPQPSSLEKLKAALYVECVQAPKKTIEELEAEVQYKSLKD